MAVTRKYYVHALALPFLMLMAASAHSQWTGWGRVDELGVDGLGSGSSIFLVHQLMQNPANCTGMDRLLVPQETATFQETYSLLLAAKVAYEDVNVFISDESCSASGYPLITTIKVR